MWAKTTVKGFLFNVVTYLFLWKLFLIVSESEWQQTASSEGRKMSPDISNYADCVRTSAWFTKTGQKLYTGIKLHTESLLVFKVALSNFALNSTARLLYQGKQRDRRGKHRSSFPWVANKLNSFPCYCFIVSIFDIIYLVAVHPHLS